MSEAAEKLRAARALVARPGGWGQGAYARDARGAPIDEHGSLAVCFCPMGALFRVAGAILALGFLRQAVGPMRGMWSIPQWNDQPGRTQADVVAAFDRAIGLAETAHA